MKPNLKKKIAEANAVFMISKLVERYPEYVRDISDFQFDRVIGKGGFGQVWLGHDLRTGKFCAIKELQAEKLTPHGVTSFLREINTMVKLRNERFILPFVGYTIDAPYSLITEYEPNGTLYDYTHKTRRKASLTNTHLTINAMCIAYGMMKMHDKSIVHRDLKCLNILMDHNYLPMICDFGTSRALLENSAHKMTPYIGTVTHMAPEILFMRPPPNYRKKENPDSKSGSPQKKDLRDMIDFTKVPLFETYGLSCDVYSYGMILYEMSQNQIPFGVSKEHIVSCIQKNTKPAIKRQTPKCLVETIYSCINHNPSKRPSFEDLYNKFKTGQIYFLETNVKTVAKFAEELEKLGPRNLPPPPQNPTVDIPSILQRLNRQHAKLKKQVEEMQENEENTSDKEKKKSRSESENASENNNNVNDDEDEVSMNILSDTSNALFMSTLGTFSEKLFNSNSKLISAKFFKFYKVISKHIKGGTSPNYLVAIIDCLTEIAKKDPVVLDHLDKLRFFSFLPVNPEKIILKSLLNLVWEIFNNKPSLVDHSMFRTLGLLLLNNEEQEETLSLFKVYSMKFDEVDDPYKIFDFLISYASCFVESKCGPDYINIFVYMLTNHSEFRSMRLRRLMNIFAAMCSSHNRFVALEATKAFANFYEPSLSEPMSTASITIHTEMIIETSTPSAIDSNSRSSFYQTSDHNSITSDLSSNSNKESSFSSLKNALYESQRKDVSLSNLFQVHGNLNNNNNNNNNNNMSPRDLGILLGDNESAPAASRNQASSSQKMISSSTEPASSSKKESNSNDNSNLFSIVKVPYKAIIRNLMDKQLSRPTLSILKRVNHFPSSRTLFRLLMKNLPQSSGIVFKFVSENSENAIIAARYTRWMQSPTTISMKIFMLIFLHKDALNVLLSDDKGIRLVSSYFTSVLATAKSTEILAAACSIVKRLPINQSFLNALTDVGFFKNLSFIVSKYSDDSLLVQSCLSFLGAVSKIGYSPDFIYFAEPLVKFLSLKNEATKFSIIVIADLSRHKELALTFNKMKLANYFSQLLNSGYKPFAAAFLKNVEKFSKEEENKE